MGEGDDFARLGLCVRCLHARHVPHPRGEIAYCMCALAESDPRYDKYPRTPVRACPGYEPRSEEEGRD